MPKNSSTGKDTELDVPTITRDQMRRGVLGKYASNSSAQLLIALDADVAKVFRDSRGVNQVLRAIIENVPPQRKLKKSA